MCNSAHAGAHPPICAIHREIDRHSARLAAHSQVGGGQGPRCRQRVFDSGVDGLAPTIPPLGKAHVIRRTGVAGSCVASGRRNARCGRDRAREIRPAALQFADRSLALNPLT